jgi:hypothetical protein
MEDLGQHAQRTDVFTGLVTQEPDEQLLLVSHIQRQATVVRIRKLDAIHVGRIARLHEQDVLEHFAELPLAHGLDMS